MILPLAALLLLGALASSASASSSSASSSSGTTTAASGEPATWERAPVQANGRAAVLGQVAKLKTIVPALRGSGLEVFGAVQATTESGFQSRVGLGIPEGFPPWARPNLRASSSAQENESRAARLLYQADRNAWARSGPYPDGWWELGSGGWYGLLPTVGLVAFRDSPAIADGRLSPLDIFDPWRSTVMMAAMVARLARRVLADPDLREGLDRDWLAIKRGMAGNIYVDDADPDDEGPLESVRDRSRAIAKKVTRILSDLGYPGGWQYRQIPSAIAARRDWYSILERGE